MWMHLKAYLWEKLEAALDPLQRPVERGTRLLSSDCEWRFNPPADAISAVRNY
jgi:hypothetical protein